MALKRPQKLLLMRKVRLRVCYALTPLILASVYLFGWRYLALILPEICP
jgi:Na+-translocating ferredoxin:NAD+ oxidoreductase RnfD subunit